MSELQGNTEIRIGSERSFGIVFCVVFLIVALWPLWGGESIRYWAMAVAAGFLMLGYLAPNVLRPLNRLWFKFGMLLSRIVSPIVMAILFFITVTPIGLIRRAFVTDPLNQKIDPKADTYWVPVDREQKAATSMRKQY